MTDPFPSAYLALTHYQVWTDFGGPGIGVDQTDHFSDAASSWADCMARGYPSMVMECRVNAPLVDVTDAARKTAMRWVINRREDLPGWVTGEVADTSPADELAQRGYDAARDAKDAAA